MFHYIHLEGVGLNENLLTEKPAGRWLRRIEATKAQFVHRNVNFPFIVCYRKRCNSKTYLRHNQKGERKRMTTLLTANKSVKSSQ